VEAAASARSYFVVTRVRGAAWDASRPMREQERWPEHARFMDELAARGFVVLGGPLGGGRRILLICDADDEDAVRTRLAADPWSATGLLDVAGVEPWAILLDGGRMGGSRER
jgi:uncharacterized protein YciI